MSLDEKRSKYKCGDRYNTLSDVPTWVDYYKEHQDKFKGNPSIHTNILMIKFISFLPQS